MDGWTGASRSGPNCSSRRSFPLSVAAQVEHGHPARSQHERGELLRFTQTTRPQSFQRRDQNLLHEILRGVFVSQVT